MNNIVSLIDTHKSQIYTQVAIRLFNYIELLSKIFILDIADYLPLLSTFININHSISIYYSNNFTTYKVHQNFQENNNTSQIPKLQHKQEPQSNQRSPPIIQ